jgi:Flp pilus assembly protein protease CpaA
VFVAGLLLFPRAAPGAVDAKPMTAMVFFIGHDHLFPSLFFMTFCGGTLPLAIIPREKFRLQRLISFRAVFVPSSTEAAGSTIATERPNVRCRVAIAATGVAMLLFRTSIE